MRHIGWLYYPPTVSASVNSPLEPSPGIRTTVIVANLQAQVAGSNAIDATVSTYAARTMVSQETQAVHVLSPNLASSVPFAAPSLSLIDYVRFSFIVPDCFCFNALNFEHPNV
ncbi:hypothetical protein TNIN_290271 [Trichonephila inaurata madagascariensis]|uniref:Uncharacterized protein n=1 Tax=Trichonephila inaurata madagascariensis TaxID=2747483 RepID=A0A8X6XTW0_9ARAC|nr:hypothetical protein TNIN_290271 [Trichonephila inaurata madagascariensis]